MASNFIKGAAGGYLQVALFTVEGLPGRVPPLIYRHGGGYGGDYGC